MELIVCFCFYRFSWLPPSDLSEQVLSPSAKKYSSMLAYNNAKLCNVLFARGLAKVNIPINLFCTKKSANLFSFTQKLSSKGVCVNSLHPGNMVSSSLSRNWWFYRLLFAFVRPFTKSLVKLKNIPNNSYLSVELYCIILATSCQHNNILRYCIRADRSQWSIFQQLLFLRTE